MSDQVFEWGSVLDVLSDHGVRYVLIGGLAARLHGSPLVTDDIDICYDRSDDNLQRLAGALTDLEATLRGVKEDVPFLLDAATLKAGDSFTFSTRFGAFDCLGTPAGTTGYRELRRNAVEMGLGLYRVAVASLQDLMRMKTAAGRPKDRMALPELQALRDRLAERRRES